jgi:hypothetical protein
MTVKLWKNFPKRKGTQISASATPVGLVEIWNSIPNMGNLKTDANGEAVSMMASRCLHLSLEAGSTPFRLLERKGYQVIEAIVEV